MSEPSIESTDWALDELEAIARAADPQNLFYRRLIEALLPILRADCVLLAIELESKPLVLYSVGKTPDPSSLQAGLIRAFSKPAAEASTNTGSNLSDGWISTRFPKTNQAMPLALLAGFDKQTPAEGLSGAKNLLDAFGEVCEVREVYVENTRAVGLWKKAASRCQDLSNASSHEQLRRGVVEAVRDALQADRASLFHGLAHAREQAHSASMIACSGAASIDPNSSLVRELEQLVEGNLAENQPKLWNATPVQAVVPRYCLLIPWPSGPQTTVHALLVEWSDPQAIIDRVQRASNLFPMLNTAWQNQNRWLHLPASVQEKANRRNASVSRSRVFSKRLVGLGCLASLVALAMIPFPYYIQAEAYLEPIEQRFIHASADSFIQELLVREGQSVRQAEPLVELRSPSLELQIEELAGQLRALGEKNNGLRVAVNQLSPNNADPANQTRLSAELKLIEIQESQALKKQQFLLKQKRELLLESPIQGMVVGGDLKRELSDRPLQRGDVLFRVADLQGPWQLKLFVADRDGGYVEQALKNGPVDIDWGLENSTRISLQAKLSTMTREVDQRPSLGPCRRATASLDSGQLDQPVIGAVAYARIPCGRRPLWFIWSRPMVEFLQKRFWLTSTPQSKTQPDVSQGNSVP
ncbi:MAG: efflux RND transporter periplasmic adaptor subunit [Planctomycetota bacterium]